MKIRKRTGCFETNSSSAHTVTFKKDAADGYTLPKEIEIDRARFDYCDDLVEGYQNKANYLWEIMCQSSGNYVWIMRFITYLAKNGIQVSFNKDWIEDGEWFDGELPYDDEGNELLHECLMCESDLMSFLFDDHITVELYEG